MLDNNMSTPNHQTQENSQPFELEQMNNLNSAIRNPKSKINNPDIAISVRNVSKRYQLYETPIHRLKETMHPFKKKYHREFWAVRDVSFEARHGETVGVIGRNGSGKSTLLQMICGTLTPTQGDIIVDGKVSSLLELGAGFNPEFTGRDNVYLNGFIMGLSQQEMDSRFEVIASFADIGSFIDQPVKTYSSGMYVRLAFACAINVDPEILIIDEALAVGDAKFQRKCFAKLEEFRKSGKTILFVSHAMGTINQICNRTILLENGQIVEQGEPKEVTKLYHKILFDEEIKPAQKDADKQNGKAIIETQNDKQNQLAKKEELERKRVKELAIQKLKEYKTKGHSDEMRYGNKKAEIIDFGILDEDGERVALVETGKRYTFFSRALIYEDLDDIAMRFAIRTLQGTYLFGCGTEFQNLIPPQKKRTVLETKFQVTMWLGTGSKYFVNLGIGKRDRSVSYDSRMDVFHFEVLSGTINRNTGPASLVDLNPHISLENTNLPI